jgi:uncharacterized protein YdeI (YjbR/CyaY-like superfamily)
MFQKIFKNRAAWRAWLAANRDKKTEIGVIFFNKASGVKGLLYEEALEEALCYGWIDSILRKLDDKRRVIRFSPRKEKSLWSGRNKAKVERLTAEGRMTASGLAKVEAAKRNGSWTTLDSIDIRLEVPADLLAALDKKPGLRGKFEALSRTRKKQYSFFIGGAKRPETRTRRIAEALERIAAGRHFEMPTRESKRRAEKKV